MKEKKNLKHFCSKDLRSRIDDIPTDISLINLDNELNSQKESNEWFDLFKDILYNLSLNFNDSNKLYNLSLNLYIDIINYLKLRVLDPPHEHFLSFFEYKSPKFFSYIFLYYAIKFNNNAKISHTDFAKKININPAIFDRLFIPIFHFLKKIPKYRMVYNFIRISNYNLNDFKIAIRHFVQLGFDVVNIENEVNFDEESFEIVFNNILMFCGDPNSDISFKQFFKNYPYKLKKSPKIIAIAYCFQYLKFEKDINIKLKDFIEFLSLQVNNFF